MKKLLEGAPAARMNKALEASREKPSRRKIASRGERGMILVMALWIMAALGLLLLCLAQSVDLNVKEASGMKSHARGSAVARGALFAVANAIGEAHAALAPVAPPSSGASANSASSSEAAASLGKLKQAFARGDELGFYLVEPFDSWKVSKRSESDPFASYGDWLRKDYAVCEVFAEDSKASLRDLKVKNWLRVDGVSQDLAKELDGFVQQSGVDLFMVEQLLALRPVQGKLFDGEDEKPGLRDILTPCSSGKIYVNRASAAALSVALDIDLPSASFIASAVSQGSFFYDVASLAKSSGADPDVLAKHASLTCGSYRIKAYAFIDGEAFKMEAVFVLGDDGSMKLLRIEGA